MLNFGERLYKLRKSRGLSLDDVSHGVGVTSSHISQLENNKRQPSFSLLLSLAEFFDVNPAFFLSSGRTFFGVGRKIRSFRILKGLSLEDLAARSGLDQFFLERIENGDLKPDKKDLEKIGEILGKDLADFEDTILTHLNTIREICAIVFNMSDEDVEDVSNFIKSKINL